jgi:hypothetical protein
LEDCGAFEATALEGCRAATSRNNRGLIQCTQSASSRMLLTEGGEMTDAIRNADA